MSHEEALREPLYPSPDVAVDAGRRGRLELTAHGPIGIDVRHDRAASDDGSEVTASIALRRGGGITGRLLSQATAALLSAGALDGAARSIARAAERPCMPAAA